MYFGILEWKILKDAKNFSEMCIKAYTITCERNIIIRKKDMHMYNACTIHYFSQKSYMTCS